MPGRIDVEYKSVSALLPESRVANKAHQPGSRLKRSVNNYLKTPEEIETEILFRAHAEMNESDALSMTTTDGYFDTHSSANEIPGTMEENY